MYINPAQILAIVESPDGNPLSCAVVGPGGTIVGISGMSPAKCAEALAAAVTGAIEPPPPPPSTLRLN
jgi:hypothetical protein